MPDHAIETAAAAEPSSPSPVAGVAIAMVGTVVLAVATILVAAFEANESFLMTAISSPECEWSSAEWSTFAANRLLRGLALAGLCLLAAIGAGRRAPVFRKCVLGYFGVSVITTVLLVGSAMRSAENGVPSWCEQWM